MQSLWSGSNVQTAKPSIELSFISDRLSGPDELLRINATIPIDVPWVSPMEQPNRIYYQPYPRRYSRHLAVVYSKYY